MIHPVEQVKPPCPQEMKASLEDTMSELTKFQLEMRKSQAKFVNETRTFLANQVAQLRNLEIQMASMFNERQQGNLPSTSEVNPRRDGKEHCKAITLRSGKTIEKTVQGSGEENSVRNDENSAGNSCSSAENGYGTTKKSGRSC